MLPILMQLVGGIIAYYALRQDDPAKARNCLLLGAALTAIGTAAFWIPIVLLVALSGPADVISTMPDWYALPESDHEA